MSTDLQRSILLGALFFVAFMLWNAWQKDYQIKPNQTVLTQSSQAGWLPTQVESTAQSDIQNVQTDRQPKTTTPIVGKIIPVSTDVLNVLINTSNGDITEIKLPQYPESLNLPNKPFVLLNNNPESHYLAQSNLIGSLGNNIPLSNIIYTADKTQYTLAENQNDLTVSLHWNNQQGLTLIKNIHFQKNSYLINIDYQIINKTSETWKGNLYAQLVRKKVIPQSKGPFHINPYVGAAISSPEQRYKQISFDKMAKENFNAQIQGGWAAMQEHYFLSAFIPNSTETYHYNTQALDNDIFLVRMTSQATSVAPNTTATTAVKLYVGPAIADKLKAIAPGLNLTVDYGIFWPIGVAIFWLLKQVHSFVYNWGWSIVIVTFLIKLAFYQLSATSYRSMAKMRRLQPRITSLRERFGDDRQKLAQATMELYKTEKINPAENLEDHCQ